MQHTRRIRFWGWASLALAFVALGCATPAERGKKALEEGNFEQAAHYYAIAAQSKPEDPEIKAGLQKARTELLGVQLIQVRQARLAGSIDQALDLLLDVQRKESEWGLTVGGKVAFTQEEEVGMGWQAFKKQILDRVAQKSPALATHRRYKLYEPLFGSKFKDWAPVGAEVSRQGKADCTALRKEAGKGHPYYERWLGQYCQYWGEEGPGGDESVAKMGVGAIDFVIKAEAIPLEVRGALKESVEARFRETPWYHPKGGKRLKLEIEAQFSQKREKTGTVLVQNYMESQQYVAQRLVTKQRQVPRSVVKYVLDPATGQSVPRETVEYVTESYTESEPYQDTRQVERTYRYPAWKHEQELSLAVAGEAELDGSKLTVTHSEKSVASGIEHDEEQPAMGLHRSRPGLPEPPQWLREQVLVFADRLKARANQLWSDQYCQAESGGGSNPSVTSSERVQRCWAARPTPTPAYVEEWFRSRTGLSAADASQSLGL